MKQIIYFICIIFQIQEVCSQNNYVLYDVSDSSDIKENLSIEIDSIDKVGMDLLYTIFKPISGNFKTYRFIETFYGVSPIYFPDSLVVDTLHNILILIVDRKNKIINGYKYFVESADYPPSCDLYKLYKTQRIKLNSKLKLSSLKFVLMNNPEYCGKDSFLYLSQINLIQENKSATRPAGQRFYRVVNSKNQKLINNPH